MTRSTRSTSAPEVPGLVDLGTPTGVPTERSGRGVTISRAADANVDLSRCRDDSSRVLAIPHVDAIVTALVWAGADASLQLLVEHDLDGRAHHVPTTVGEVPPLGR